MDNNTLAIYIHELRNQCTHLQASFDIFNQSVKNNRQSGILYGGQLILTAGSQIAGILWPSRARARTRGESIRKALQLPEKHPLNDRRLSEINERPDEKLEDWIASTRGEQIVFDLVGDPLAMDGGTVKETSVYRAYNPEKGIFFYRGTAYSMQAIAKALADVANRIQALFKQIFPQQAAAEEKAIADAEAAAKASQKGAEKATTEPEPVTTVPAEETPATKTPATKTSATKTSAKKPAAKKTPVKKAAAPKTTTKKTAAKKPAAKKTPAKKASVKKDAKK